MEIGENWVLPEGFITLSSSTGSVIRLLITKLDANTLSTDAVSFFLLTTLYLPGKLQRHTDTVYRESYIYEQYRRLHGLK